MDLRYFDNKCVRITVVSGNVYEGTASYLGREYVYHEYGCDQEALYITPIMFYKNDISSIYITARLSIDYIKDKTGMPSDADEGLMRYISG